MAISGHFSKRASKSFARFQLRRSDFELRSSNGYPLNAVSLQDGMISMPAAVILSLFLGFYCVLCVEFFTLRLFDESFKQLFF